MGPKKAITELTLYNPSSIYLMNNLINNKIRNVNKQCKEMMNYTIIKN